jgi:hypothetical protein
MGSVKESETEKFFRNSKGFLRCRIKTFLPEGFTIEFLPANYELKLSLENIQLNLLGRKIV